MSHLQFFYERHQGVCQVLLETYLRQKVLEFWTSFHWPGPVWPFGHGYLMRLSLSKVLQVLTGSRLYSLDKQTWIWSRSLVNKRKGSLKSRAVNGGSVLFLWVLEKEVGGEGGGKDKHLSVASCTCPTEDPALQPLGTWDNAPASWATQPVLFFNICLFFPFPVLPLAFLLPVNTETWRGAFLLL